MPSSLLSIGWMERRKTRERESERERERERERGRKREKGKKEICIFDEEESSYVSLSDCQASTLMRRGVISETVYWLDPSREGGSLSTSSRSLIPPPPAPPGLPLHASSTRFTISYRRWRRSHGSLTPRGYSRLFTRVLLPRGMKKRKRKKNCAIKSTTPEARTRFSLLLALVGRIDPPSLLFFFLFPCNFSEAYLRS